MPKAVKIFVFNALHSLAAFFLLRQYFSAFVLSRLLFNLSGTDQFVESINYIS